MGLCLGSLYPYSTWDKEFHGPGLLLGSPWVHIPFHPTYPVSTSQVSLENSTNFGKAIYSLTLDWGWHKPSPSGLSALLGTWTYIYDTSQELSGSPRSDFFCFPYSVPRCMTLTTLAIFNTRMKYKPRESLDQTTLKFHEVPGLFWCRRQYMLSDIWTGLGEMFVCLPWKLLCKHTIPPSGRQLGSLSLGSSATESRVLSVLNC